MVINHSTWSAYKAPWPSSLLIGNLSCHKGAKYLRPATQSHLVPVPLSDVIGFLLACVAAAVFVITKCFLFPCRKFAETGMKRKREQLYLGPKAEMPHRWNSSSLFQQEGVGWKGSYLLCDKMVFTVQHLLSKFVYKECFNGLRFRKMLYQDDSWWKLYKSKCVNIEIYYFKSEVLLKNHWICYNSVSHGVHRHLTDIIR